MTRDGYNNFCASLPATFHVVQWGNADVWKVGDARSNKVFAVGGWTKNKTMGISFKTTPMAFDILKDIPGCAPAPYLASRGMKWIQHTSGETLNDDDLRAYIRMSHQLAAANLPKKKRAALGLD